MTTTTYREAYRDIRWSLCSRHSSDEGAAEREAAGVGSLGPVEHGAHNGECDVCEHDGDAR